MFLVSLFFIAGAVYASTTIGTDVQTNGNLFLGGASTTDIGTVGTGNFFYGNATYGCGDTPASNGGCPPFQIESTFTDPASYALAEVNATYNPTGDVVNGNETFAAGSTFTGTHAFDSGIYTAIYGQNYMQSSGGMDTSSIFYSNSNVQNGNLRKSTDVWLGAPSVSNGGSISEREAIWIADQANTATNAYYSWDDSRGVRRVKEDNTFNSVGQAIEALYNPQFAKYTPGATDYERVVLGQWNSNVAEIGTEAGGTGTLRPLKLLGSQLIIPDHLSASSANNDFDGTISISSATSAAHTFTTAFNSAPSCIIVPTTDPTAVGTYWVTTSTSAVTANVHTSGTINFSYHCVGNPN